MRGRHAGAALLGAALGAAAPVALADPASAAAPRIRVLVAEGAASVRVEPLDPSGARAEAPSTSVAWSAGTLVRDGEAVGGRLRFEDAASWRVGSLRVRGAVELLAEDRGIAVVNELPLEDYVCGTLGVESFAGWGREALRAQAVVARTYAVHEQRRRARTGRPYDLRATTTSQRYGGLDAESEPVRAATQDTAGEVLLYDGAPILAVYHAASGGRTASAAEVWNEPLPYLRTVPVEGEEIAPDTYWRAQVSPAALSRALASLGCSVGAVSGIEVTERSESGRARLLRVVGSGGEASVLGTALRAALGESLLRSTLFDVRPLARGAFLFVGSGSGHGVGLSQWGAFAMATRGADYRAILARFYPGTSLERITRGAR